MVVLGGVAVFYERGTPVPHTQRVNFRMVSRRRVTLVCYPQLVRELRRKGASSRTTEEL